MIPLGSGTGKTIRVAVEPRCDKDRQVDAHMLEQSQNKPGECLLVYDGRCRMCVTAKQGLDRLRSEGTASKVRMMAYQSEEARQVLGDLYRPGRPEAAFLVGPQGDIAQGLDAFLPLLGGLKGGRILAVLFQVPLVKPLGYFLYRWVARYRYQLFGEVLLGSSESTAVGNETDRPFK